MFLERFLILLLRNLLILPFLLILGACDFKPLYGPYSSFPQDDLRQIDVKVISERTGQMMRNHLIYLLQHNARLPKIYTLEITLEESRSDQVYDRDATSKRTNIKITAQYKLKKKGEKDILYSQVLEDSIGFSFGSNAEFASFASITSESDAKERIIQHLSRKIVEQLSIFFHHHKNSKQYD